MNTPKFQDQYDKIIQAYFKDEIKPMDSSFCFCGTLAGGNGWAKYLGRKTASRNLLEEYGYSANDYVRMEYALLCPLKEIGAEKSGVGRGAWYGGKVNYCDSRYEDLLFTGMCAALEVLKQIHLERGEVIDEPPLFKKRELHPLSS